MSADIVAFPSRRVRLREVPHGCISAIRQGAWYVAREGAPHRMVVQYEDKEPMNLDGVTRCSWCGLALDELLQPSEPEGGAA